MSFWKIAIIIALLILEDYFFGDEISGESITEYIIESVHKWLLVHCDWDARMERFRRRKERITDEERIKRPMKKYRLCFVCHGNICRSPMAEFVMKDMVEKAGLAERFLICSKATSTEELGNPVYPPAREELAKHGMSCKGKYAVQVKKSDYTEHDMFVIMDDWNRRNIMRIFGDDPQGKVRKLMDFAGGGDVDDPWYTRRFDTAYGDIERGCKGLLEYLKGEL